MKKQKGGLADIIQKIESGQNGRMSAKLPLWAQTEGVQLPSSLALQQCSSQLTADFKAGLLKDYISEGRGTLADLTGGFGVDSFAFSHVFDKVLYFEQNPELCKVTEKNLKLLCDAQNRTFNLECKCETVDSQTIAGLGKVDCIYMDPARRDGTGKKVFLLEDCTPNVLELLPAISEVSPLLMLKLSPMADITMLRKRLSETESGFSLISTGVIGLKGEVKELLLLLGRHESKEQSYIVNCDEPDSFLQISFGHSAPNFVSDAEIANFRYLLEPDALLLKTGAHEMLGDGAVKLSRDCHIYLSDELPQGALAHHFKAFEIIEGTALDKNAIRDFAKKYPGAAVTAKAIPMTSEELAKRLKITRTTSAATHLFGVSTARSKYLIAAARI